MLQYFSAVFFVQLYFSLLVSDRQLFSLVYVFVCFVAYFFSDLLFALLFKYKKLSSAKIWNRSCSRATNSVKVLPAFV